MKLSLSFLAVLGLGFVAGAQVGAPEFTARLLEQKQTGVRMSGSVKLRLSGVVEIEADEVVIDKSRPDDIRLQGNVVARRLAVQP